MPKSLHHDRGDGVCARGFEPWPCAVEKGEAEICGIQEFEREELLEAHLEHSLRLKEAADQIRAIMIDNGYEELAQSVVDFSLTATLDTESLRDLLVALQTGVVEWE